MEFENSKTICQGLTEKIVEQNNIREDRPAEPVQRIRRRVAYEREERYKVQLELLRSTMSAEQICANDLAQLKGTSIWLTALPLADEGYVINTKWEFFDTISDSLCLSKGVHCRPCLIVFKRRFHSPST